MEAFCTKQTSTFYSLIAVTWEYIQWEAYTHIDQPHNITKLTTEALKTTSDTCKHTQKKQST
jgi:hypothetical protein